MLDRGPARAISQERKYPREKKQEKWGTGHEWVGVLLSELWLFLPWGSGVTYSDAGFRRILLATLQAVKLFASCYSWKVWGGVLL